MDHIVQILNWVAWLRSSLCPYYVHELSGTVRSASGDGASGYMQVHRKILLRDSGNNVPLSAENIKLLIEDKALRCPTFVSSPAPFSYLPAESYISFSFFRISPAEINDGRGEGGLGAKSYDSEKAWSSTYTVNHSNSLSVCYRVLACIQ